MSDEKCKTRTERQRERREKIRSKAIEDGTYRKPGRPKTQPKTPEEIKSQRAAASRKQGEKVKLMRLQQREDKKNINMVLSTINDKLHTYDLNKLNTLNDYIDAFNFRIISAL